MKRFAVAYINFFDNELITEVIEAETPKAAIAKHSRIAHPDIKEWVEGLPEDLDQIKDEFWNGDQGIDVIEV